MGGCFPSAGLEGSSPYIVQSEKENKQTPNQCRTGCVVCFYLEKQPGNTDMFAYLRPGHLRAGPRGTVSQDGFRRGSQEFGEGEQEGKD